MIRSVATSTREPERNQGGQYSTGTEPSADPAKSSTILPARWGGTPHARPGPRYRVGVFGMCAGQRLAGSCCRGALLKRVSQVRILPGAHLTTSANRPSPAEMLERDDLAMCGSVQSSAAGGGYACHIRVRAAHLPTLAMAVPQGTASGGRGGQGGLVYSSLSISGSVRHRSSPSSTSVAMRLAAAVRSTPRSARPRQRGQI
jgi:hypothetical protein